MSVFFGIVKLIKILEEIEMSKKHITGEDGKKYVMKEKKPFYKKVWFWLLAIVVLIIFGGALGGSDTDNTKSSDASKETSKESAKKEEKTYGIGDIVSVGDMEYAINSVETAKQIGPSVFPTNAKDTFLIVDMKVKNNGNEAVTVDSSFFKLKEGEKTFEADSMASMSANQNENGEIVNSFFLEQLNPDMEQTGKIVFDISESQATSENNILQAQTGYFGTKTVNINLK